MTTREYAVALRLITVVRPDVTVADNVDYYDRPTPPRPPINLLLCLNPFFTVGRRSVGVSIQRGGSDRGSGIRVSYMFLNNCLVMKFLASDLTVREQS